VAWKRAFSTNKSPRHEKISEKNTNLLHWLLKSDIEEKKNLAKARDVAVVKHNGRVNGLKEK